MITNTNDIQKYTQTNKMYIPQEYNNSNWQYRINGDNYITIITNRNCYTNYNTTYCECYNYNYKENVISTTNSCNINSTSYMIPYGYITSDINYSDRITTQYIKDKGIMIGIILIAILFAIMILKDRRY